MAAKRFNRAQRRAIRKAPGKHNRKPIRPKAIAMVKQPRKEIPIDFINTVIVDSIPVRRDLKRWLLSRFRKLCRCNGRAYATAVFSEAKVVCMAYRADPSRISHLDEYERKLPFRTSGWTKRILQYMDTSPCAMIDLLKLPISFPEPLISVRGSAEAEHQYLLSTANRVNTKVPTFLRDWLEFIKLHANGFSLQEYERLVTSQEPGSTFCRCHDYAEVVAYINKWRHLLFRFRCLGEKEAQALLCEVRNPVPEMYKDCEIESTPSIRNDKKVTEIMTSASLEKDYWEVCYWLDESGIVDLNGHTGRPALSFQSRCFLKSYLSQAEDAFSLWEEVSPNEFSLWAPRCSLPFLSGEVVGEIQHIPKKGTAVRRPIAVPNRFIQLGLVPIADDLSRLLRRLPCDATYDQGRFDIKITGRVSNPNLYVGSVDLSHATDNLPFSWGRYIVLNVLRQRLCPTSVESWHLFEDCASSFWDNGGTPSCWPVGQPLGTLPSFPLLGITHNLICESLAWSLGLGHSPYAVLGDDLVVFNRKLRAAYIGLMRKWGIPLSLHKSYEGNLVEFAGKVFVRNHVPAYTPDHATITWESLFDYQRASGVEIRWSNLPERLKSKVRKVLEAHGVNPGGVKDAYNRLAAILSRSGSASPTGEFSSDWLRMFYEELAWSDSSPDRPAESSGILPLGGRPVTYKDMGYAAKGGHLLRYHRTQLPSWFKDKFRPVTTDKLLVACASAETGVSLSRRLPMTKYGKNW